VIVSPALAIIGAGVWTDSITSVTNRKPNWPPFNDTGKMQVIKPGERAM